MAWLDRFLARENDLAEERCLRNGWRRQLARLPVEREWLAENGHVLSDR
jgi:hypothetical protein